MGAEIDTLRELEAQGYFDRVRAGDHRAAGLFTRLAAYALNPAGDPRGWGCLRKTAGGQNVEGYSEDAIVLGNDPSNRRNVVDIIGGAGAPGASIGWGRFVERRASDVWEAPVPLDAERMAYLRPGAVPGPSPTPTPSPTPAPTPCAYQPVDLGPVLGVLEELRQRLDVIAAQQSEHRQETQRAEAKANNISDRLQNGLTLDGSVRYIGSVSGRIHG